VQGGWSIEIVSRDTEAVFGSAVEADERDMERAVAAARRAFDKGHGRA